MRRPLRSTASLLLAAALWCSPLAAQARAPDDRPSPPKSLCFSGAPADRCANFLLFEAGVAYPALQSTREVSLFASRLTETGIYDGRAYWELGLMHNLGPRWGVGGTLGLGNQGLRSGAVRARKWLNPELGLDLTAGVVSWNPERPGPANCTYEGLEGSCVYRQGSLPAARLEARLDFSDALYAGVALEQVSVPPYSSPWSYEEGGALRSVSLIGGLGGGWAVGGTLGLAAVVLVLLVSLMG